MRRVNYSETSADRIVDRRDAIHLESHVVGEPDGPTTAAVMSNVIMKMRGCGISKATMMYTAAKNDEQVHDELK